MLQATVAVTLTPSISVAATAATQVTFTSAAITTGLTGNTDYSYTLDLGAGAGASTCISIGRSANSTGALPAVGPVPATPATYTDNATPYTATMAVYLSSSCPTGAAPSTGAVAVATGTARIRVSTDMQSRAGARSCSLHTHSQRSSHMNSLQHIFQERIQLVRRSVGGGRACTLGRAPCSLRASTYTSSCRRTRRCYSLLTLGRQPLLVLHPHPSAFKSHPLRQLGMLLPP